MDRADRLVAADIVAVLPRLRRYARVLVGGRAGADELVARTLAGAWRKQRAWPAGVGLPTWLFGLMHASHRRGLQRGAAAPRQTSGPLAAGADPGAGPCAECGDGGVDAVCARVLRLPVEEREVLMLAAVERLSYADIAGLLDVPMATVVSRLARARERLCAMDAVAADSRAPP